MRSLLLTLAALCAVLLALAGCQPVPGDETLLEAYRLGKREARWDLAMPLLKVYVNAHPHDVGGHFLLGQAYLHSTGRWLLIAEGELRTALARYQFTKQAGPIAQILEPKPFEAAIHRELALLYMRMAHEAMAAGGAEGAEGFAQEQLRRALDHTRLGRQLDPDAAYLRQMEDLLEGRRGGGQPGTPPENARRSLADAF